jgi:NAD(P)-dependent dehydrogenase (short-subunit alcohol dehydrogenase family)
MSGSVAGKRALVTGASTGIGAAVARDLAAAGCTVGICARRTELLDEVLADCQAHAPDSRRWTIDLADLAAVDAFAAAVEAELGGVDILVNNAGIPKRRHVRALTPAEVDAVMTVNYLSPVRLTLALLPGMLERGEGHIVNISSVAARLGPPREAAYSASKAAITAFSESMSCDLSGTGITIQVVNPGIIDTDLFHLPDNDPSLSDLPAERPEDMASAIRLHLESGGFELWFPGWFHDVNVTKASDIDGFLAGSALYAQERERAMSVSPSDRS